MVQQVVTIAGLKGGTGKTSTAVNLAAFWSASRSTLLIDADPNGSASKWHQRSEGGLGRCVPIQQAPMAMAQSWEVVVMDTAGGSRDEQRTYAEGSAFVLAPCPPAASSIEQVIDLGELLQQAQARYAVVLTMVDQRRAQDASKARELLERLGIPVLSTQISLLSAWPKAEAAGVSVKDARADSGRPDPGASRAWKQVAALAAEIEERLT
ncbi:chromosome partitioning protein [Synechococcus sp. Ace-Pa]|uniref:ParA family protein n=1 Tax=Synechococcus sp. Ace-Pa TaxID=2572902 RepID=UPI0011A92D21|nr:ParA family protein [Synechococcus sp. Ace-Pa]MCT4364776.1 ParA family protein [Candidatus Regnicoccus frigidus MAG-AL1]TWB87683.1 chromosome partitioning protein [Synechococcus sp. Ace-Pa]